MLSPNALPATELLTTVWLAEFAGCCFENQMAFLFVSGVAAGLTFWR
jgi:hypothetical protein